MQISHTIGNSFDQTVKFLAKQKTHPSMVEKARKDLAFWQRLRIFQASYALSQLTPDQVDEKAGTLFEALHVATAQRNTAGNGEKEASGHAGKKPSEAFKGSYGPRGNATEMGLHAGVIDLLRRNGNTQLRPLCTPHARKRGAQHDLSHEGDSHLQDAAGNLLASLEIKEVGVRGTKRSEGMVYNGTINGVHIRTDLQDYQQRRQTGGEVHEIERRARQRLFAVLPVKQATIDTGILPGRLEFSLATELDLVHQMDRWPVEKRAQELCMGFTLTPGSEGLSGAFVHGLSYTQVVKRFVAAAAF